MSGLMIGFIVLSYFLGSIPYGYLIGHFWGGKEIQKEGSKSIGAINVGRVTGRVELEIITLILDMLMKGTVAVAIAYYVFGTKLMIVLMLTAAILGHLFPVFTKFQGGKGVAALIGGIFGLAVLEIVHWGAFLFASFFWVIILILSFIVFGSGIRFIANLGLVGLLLLFTWVFTPCWEFGAFALYIFSLISWAHRENFGRLWRSEEKGREIEIKFHPEKIGSLVRFQKEEITSEPKTVIKLNLLKNIREIIRILMETVEIKFKK